MLEDQLYNLKLNTFVAIDVETTGTDISKDRIIELSACKYKDGKLLETYSHLINPQKKLTPFIIKLTGITDDDLENKPVFSMISESFVDFIDNMPLVCHNIEFDINFYDIIKDITLNRSNPQDNLTASITLSFNFD